MLNWNVDDPITSARTAWNWLPTVIGAIGGFFGALFYLVQLYESRTFQHWKSNYLMKRRAKKLIRLEAKKKIVIAQIEALKKLKSARVEARELVAVASAEAAKVLTQQTAEIDKGNIVDAAKKIVADDAQDHPTQ